MRITSKKRILIKRKLKEILGVKKTSDNIKANSTTFSKHDEQETSIGTNADENNRLVDTKEVYEMFADDLSESTKRLEKLAEYIEGELT